MVYVKVKYYDDRYPNYGKRIIAIVNWDLVFLKKIKDEFGIGGVFASIDLQSIFWDVADYNSVRQKLIHLYKKGLLIRKKVDKDIPNKKHMGRRSNYLYTFSNYAKERMENVDNYQERIIDENYNQIIREINERRICI